MRGLERFSLSFFKENKLSYRFECGNITFACFFCYSEASMDASSTEWHCPSCGNKGSIRELVKKAKDDGLSTLSKITVFNPRYAEYRIKTELNSLIENCGDVRIKKRLLLLKTKQEELICYLKKKARD